MSAEGARKGGRVGVHVVHAVVGVAEIAEFGVFKGGKRCNGTLIDSDAAADLL